ncbi:MAG: hypothetical protein JNK23_11605 [Opitutaceae bacterium]|nr:hypothetical protein [Opitutaceae bacterium]
MDTPSTQLWFALALAAAINGVIVRYFFRRLQDQVLLGGVAFFFLLQCGWMALYLLLTGSAVVLIGPELSPNLNDTPYAVTLGQTILPLVAVVCGRLFTHRRHAGTFFQIQQLNRQRVPGFEALLCVFATGLVLYFVGTVFVRVPIVTQAISYLHLAFFMTPLLIGLCWRRYPIAAAIFGVAVVIGGILALGAGSRALLFLPLAFFALGVWLTLSRLMRVWAALGSVLLIVPVFYLSARIETVRKDGTVEREGDLLARAGEIRRLVGESSRGEGVFANFTRGVERMIIWSNFVALGYSPDRVPYRGFDDFTDEFRFMNQSTLFREANDYLDESLDREFGLGAARRYGFSISVGGSVPFPVLADGWSRAGIWGVVLFGGGLCLLWGGLERGIRRLFADKPHLALALLVILLSSAYEKMSTYGFIYNLRYLVMQAALWGGLFYLASKTIFTAPAPPPEAMPAPRLRRG